MATPLDVQWPADLPRIYRGEAVLNIPQPDWLIEDYLQEGGLTIIHGDPGSGKSLIAQDWAMNITLGNMRWNDRRVKKGNVLFLMGEGQGGLPGRIMAWKAHYKAPVTPPVGWMLDVPSIWRAPGTQPSNEIAAVRDYLKDAEVDLVVIDTLSAAFGGGNENQQQDMNQFVDTCHRFMDAGSTVLVVHHNAKSTGAARGSTVLWGAADCMITTDAVFEDDYLMHTTIACGKRKDGLPFPRTKLKAVNYKVNTHFGNSVVLAPDYSMKKEETEET